MNLVKKAAFSLLEGAFAKTAAVLSVNSWQHDTFFEVEIHCPDLNMEKWAVTQHMKVKVAEGAFRDYTPANWDASTRTCLLLVDAVHEGPGSHWARGLSAGDTLVHVGVASALQKPEPSGNMVCLGDLSSLGQFLAIRQLAGGLPVTIVVSAKDEAHHDHLESYGVIPVKQQDTGGESALMDWWEQHGPANGTVYVAGHMRTCIQVRKRIKSGNFGGAVKVAGFWK